MADEKEMNVPQNPGGSSTPEESSAAQVAGQAVKTAAKSPSTPKPETGTSDEAASAASPVVNHRDASEEDAEATMLKMLEDLPEEDNQTSADDIDIHGSQVSKAEFQQLSAPAQKGEARNMDMLMDVNLPVAIELGRTKMSISDILALGPGSVVELNKLAGEPVDLLVNQKIVARGEVVVIDENFGVRVTQLVTPQERLQSLAEDE